MRVPQNAQQTVPEQEAETTQGNWRLVRTGLVHGPAGGAGQGDVQQCGRIVRTGRRRQLIETEARHGVAASGC